MKKLLILLMVALVAIPGALAQKKVPHKEKMKELQEFKMKFLAQEIDLADDQKQKFFDTYSAMNEERKRVFEEAKAVEKRVKADKNATDADYVALNDAWTSAKAQDAAIEKKYDEKFSTFLSPKQIVKMKQAEDSFRKKMRDMHHKRSKNKKQ